MFVTRASGNMIHELDGEPPTTILGELFAKASPRDQSLFRTSLFLGVEMRPAQLEYGQGDFLVRNLLGADNDSGAIAVAADLAERQVVQFHLRDGETASRDLHLRLSDYQDRLHDDDAQAAPSGALLFSCLGRGEQLYGVPNHDIDAFGKHLGNVPLAGFFCNGELGPVGGTPFLHGYTSAFAIFRSRNRQA
jgi:small ligand-binding sensory domain FIST